MHFMQILNIFIKFNISKFPPETRHYSVRIQFFLQILTHLRHLEFNAFLILATGIIYINNLLSLWFELTRDRECSQ